MFELIKPLVIILFLSSFTFYIGKKLAPGSVDPSEYYRWYFIWVLSTSVAFITGNFWIYAIFITAVFWLMRTRDLLIYYILLLPSLPIASIDLGGFGIVESLFPINHSRLFSIIVLLPLILFSRPNVELTARIPRIPIFLLIAYVCLTTGLEYRIETVTGTFRFLFVTALDMIFPVFVFAHFVRTTEDFQRILFALFVGMLALAFLGIFELTRDWQLYLSLYDSWATSNIVSYLRRGGFLRASTTGLGPIIFGYMVMMGIGAFLAFRNIEHVRFSKTIVYSILFLGLFSSLSRGPWVGTVALVAAYIVLERKQIFSSIMFLSLGILSLLVVYISPFGDRLEQILPFTSSGEQVETVDYRFNLFEISLIVVKRNFWFGSANFLEESEMQQLIQGQGIVDVVNSYLGIALEYGVVGLALFSLFFAWVAILLFRAISKLDDSEEELKLIGISLFATLIGVLVTIATVSSIFLIPILYWILAGLCLAYIRVVNSRETTPQEEFNVRIRETPVPA